MKPEDIDTWLKEQLEMSEAPLLKMGDLPDNYIRVLRMVKVLREALQLIMTQNEGFTEDFCERVPVIATEALAYMGEEG